MKGIIQRGSFDDAKLILVLKKNYVKVKIYKLKTSFFRENKYIVCSLGQ